MTTKKLPYSTYWLDPNWGQIAKLPADSPEFARGMLSLMRSVTDFIKIDLGKELPVKFSQGKTSYTDGETIILSAVTDPYDIDVLVGLAHHEAAHCLYSKALFDYLARIRKMLPANGGGTNGADIDKLCTIKVDNTDKADAAFATEKKVKSHQMLLNLMEDMRIDQIMYSNLKGYRKYYERLYEYYLDSDQAKALRAHPEMRKPYLDSYFFWISQTANGRNSDMNVLPGFQEIMDLIDYKNIRRFDDKLAEMPATVREIEAVINKHFIFGKPQPKMQDKGGNEIDLGLDNLDGGSGEPITITDDQLKEYLDRMAEMGNDISAVQGQGRTSGTVQLTPTQQQMWNAALKDKNINIGSVGKFGGGAGGTQKKIAAYIIRNVTPKMIAAGDMLFTEKRGWGSSNLGPAVDQGIRMGRMLAGRVSVTQDETLMTYPRQNKGRIDKRRVAALGTGAADVFAVNKIEACDPVYIHLTIDGSGSMHGEPFEKSMMLAAAFATMADKLRKFDISISLRTFSNDGAPYIAIIYDSRKDSITKLHTVFKNLTVAGGTPEGLAIEAIYENVFAVEKSYRKFLINLSDGMPGNIGHVDGVTYTKRVIDDIRRMGVTILSYYIGAEHYQGPGGTVPPAFQQMYGKDAAMIQVNNINGIATSFSKMMLRGE